MKKETLYTIISSAICLLTLIIFVAFWDKLPERVPVQINFSGNVSNTMPKAFFVFGLPLVFLIINVINCLKLNKTETKAFKYFIVPIVMLVLSIAMIMFGMYFK